jgi:predicted RNA binding protein YcfA (HicA-like mRNA interferase family)
MGRLAGFKYKDVIAKLRRAGYIYDRQAKGSHEIWRHTKGGGRVVVPNHPGDLPEGTVKAIVKAVGLSTEEFLQL